MLTLLVLQGPDKGQRFELPEEQLVVGRESRQIPLSDNTVSRRHCEISSRDGVWVLIDLGSANGTYVNGLRVKSPQAIRVGDQLRIGRTLMVFGTQPGGRSAARDAQVEMEGAETGMDSAIMHTVSANEDSLVLAVPDPSAAAVGNLQVLYRLAAALAASFDVEQAMAITMDLVFDQVKAERGLVLLRDEANGELMPVVVRTREPEKEDAPAGKPTIHASRTIIDHVVKSGEGVLSSNAMADTRFSKGKSVHELGIRSALCVPIKARRLDLQGAGSPAGPVGGSGMVGVRGGVTPGGNGAPMDAGATSAAAVLGVIYIDSSVKNYTYSPDQLRLLSAIGVQAGLAVQNARLYQAGIRAERMAAIGETSAALSHSIKNILQALRGGADVVEMGLSGGNLGQAGKGWSIVQRNLDKIFSLTMNLLAYSKSRQPQIELITPAKIIRECVETMAAAAAEKKVMVVADVDEDQPPVPMDESGLNQVLMNLLTNAVDAVQPGKGLVRVVSRYDASNEQAVIEVVDNGPGIAPTMTRHLFELFHSTKGNRGTGLGLAVSRKIVEEHEGTIAASSSPVEGTTFTVRLPMRRMMQEMADLDGTAGPANEIPNPSAIRPGGDGT